MAGNSNTLFVTVYGRADAFGDLTVTNATTKTFAGAGFAVGFGAVTAVAEGTTAVPYTGATTYGLADGGSITSSSTGHISIDFPYGPAPVVSVSVSMTFVATSGVGDFGLASPSVHGLLC